ncbi:uncharacterized protein LOC130261889 [Oenanthe melanoleuca]|uniref:uncharacterized protein LOC130261889 n=1 Tax=Oenanthe melanoleuca TaxID=2939378 RepID=UPI0024C203EF|nr:uncharacterized protein LOC130261889 [Oenanthe melanoleuca]
MNLPILTAVLLGLVLTPALADYSQQTDNNCQVSVGGVFQNMTLSSQTLVVVIEQRSDHLSWKTIWHYKAGIIATKVMPERTCYISTMNRNEMPSFENMVKLASQNRNLLGFGRPNKKITFVTSGLVNNLTSYGIDITAMCSGLTTYMAYEVHRPQVNLGSCVTLDVLRVVELQYCNGNGTGNGNGQIPQFPGNLDNGTQVIIGGQSQIVTINMQWRVAIIEQNSISGSWKTIWNYNTGVIATKVTQQNTCYISIMNKNEMPSFNNLARLAQESRNQIGFGRPTKKITFVANGLVNNLRSYGADVFSMCNGLTTYMAYEVHGPQVNLGSCITLDVLRVVDLKYCTGNGNGNGQIPQFPGNLDNGTQVIIGGQSQIVTINMQWRVAIIEQNSISGSWKTIWNYNTGVIATKVTQQNTCYISIMNKNEMPSFNNLARLAQESRNQIGFGRPTKKITFVANGLVNNLRSYGADVFSMCNGLTTYMAYEVHGPQVNLGSCITLDVLRVVDLKYCTGNGNGNGQIPQFPGNLDNGTQVIIGGQSQIVTINMQWRVAIIEQNSISGSWKTIWNYNTGVIATKVTQQNTCYISIMNKNEMPSFNNLARLAQESRNQIGFGRPTKKITFVANGLVNNLRSYGADVFSMCNGLTTYMAYEVHGPQVNLGSCITLDVLRVVDLKYCTGNGNGNGQIPQFPGNLDNGTQVIIGGQSQIVTINMQWRVAIIEQNSISGSWKTIWNYNTGVIATKVTQQNTCYISIMNKNEMPSFNNLARLAQESRNQIGFGRPTKKITFVANGLVNNLRSYGADVFSMCNGLTTYMAYEVHGPQVNLGSCITLDVLRVVDLKYCTGNGNGNGQIPQFPGNLDNGTQVIIGGQSQIVTINMQWRVAIIEQNSISGSWKTIWNYNTGVIATKVTQQNTCYISIMNKNEMPSFNNLARLAQESRNQIGFGRPTKKITFVANGLVNNLRSYGADVFSMCNGLTTYMAYEVHGPQVNLGSCITLDVLRVVDLKYCTGNGNGNGQIPQFPGNLDNGTQVIIGGQSQIVTINMQWRVAIIEQNSISGSWKTIWNYNTGVIATKVTQQNTCYISIMNKNEMPSFNNLARLAQESRNQIGFGRPTKKITFVANGLVNNLRSYGADVFSMCNGLTTYMAYEVHGPQVNLGSCITLDVLRVVDLKYCTGNGNGNGQIPQFPGNLDNGTQVIIGGQSQIVTINMQWRVAIIEQNSISGSWKTIWNYNTGVIATKVTQQNTCYISIMNKNEMPSFNNLARLAQESRNQIGFGRPTKKITFVANGLVNNLRSYGADVFSMCNGLTTYMAYEVHGPQVNLGSCITLDVLRVVDLKYCTGNGNGNGQIPQFPGNLDNGTQVIIGGQSQIVTINMQWRVAIIEQNSISGSWKTIWNYNTGVIATKVTQQNTCYISIMNKNEMPSFNNLARLAQESRNQIGFGRPTKKITFVANGLVNNLRSYGADVFSMCNGLTTYMAYEVHGPQVNLGSCITLDVLRVVDLKYCTGNGNGNGQIPQFPGNLDNGTQVIIGGQSQIVTINMQWRVAIIEQNSISGSWKTIWNYNTGVIATKVTQQNTCYISIMNKNEMPSFNNLARLAQESRNQIGFGRPTKKITFVANGLVNNLRSYGADVFSMCNGLTTYMAYEVHGPQVNLGSCITLDVLRVVDLKYCTGNGNGNGQIPQFPGNLDNGTQVIIGGQSQIVTINMQWRVAIIEQNSISGSWKTIWNYNTGVIATKVTQQNTCYISIMNKNEMPSFNNLARLAQESRNQIGFGRPTKKITFVANGLVNNLRSYGADVFSMCNGLTTYMAYEVHGPQVNLGSCITLDVLRVVDLKYCTGNGNGNGQIPQFPGNLDNGTQVIIGGQSQIVTINMQWRVAIIEQNSISGSWKTIWNYNTGVIATKVTQQNTCYISIMNKNEMPSFNNLARLAQESRNQIGFGRPTKKITFVANGLVNNLRSYGADVFSMCNGLTTYMAYEVHGPQVNLGSCITLDVLRVVDLKYCTGNGNGNGQSQQPNHNCHFSGGCIYQNMSVSGQTHVAIFEQRSNQFSWKTIWNYNTGIIATKVVQGRTCYISTMNRNVMPSFDALVIYASENRNQIGFGRPTKKITFVTNGLVNNLMSYGADVFSMCSGLTTYMAHEVHGPQLNQGSCISLDVLKLVDLNYCGGNIKA